MYTKKEREFQYHPGIEQIISDVIGGGTIDRTDLDVSFGGVRLDELPPLTVVGKDATTGVWHAIKTAEIHAAAAVDATEYQVKKKHLFKVGDSVSVGGALSGAADVITAINKSGSDHDVLTLAGTIGAAAKGAVLVLAKAKAAAGSSEFKYNPAAITMNKIDLTVANQSSGLLEAGKVNESVMPFAVDDAIKALLGDIRFV